MTFETEENSTGPKPNDEPSVERKPVLTTDSGRRGFRVREMMYIVAACAIAVWLLTIVGVALVLFGFFGVAAVAIALAVVFVRRNAVQRESFLWALAIAAERNQPLAPAALAFAETFGTSFRLRVQFFANLLNEGTAIATALDRVRGLFTREAQILVRTGATTGTLPKALRDAAAAGAMRHTAWGAIAARFVYLGGVIFVMQVIIGFIMYFIIPKFEAIFKDFGVPLPGMTIFAIQASHFIVKYFYLAFPIFMLIEVFVLFILPLGLFNIYQWDVPLVDTLFRRRHSSLIMRCLALVVEGKKSISSGITSLAADYPSKWARRRLRQVDHEVSMGGDWVQSLLDQGLIGSADAGVIASAQRVGNLEWALRELADSCERRIGYRAQLWLQILFPMLVICLGAFVLVITVAYFSPLLTLIQRLSG